MSAAVTSTEAASRASSRERGRRRSSPSSSAPTSPRERANRGVVTAVLLLVAAAFLAPMLWLLLASVDPGAQLSTQVPDAVSLVNFGAVLTVETTLRPLANSMLLCLGTAVITVVAGTLAAYPLSRYRLRFTQSFLYTILFATGLPLTAVMVPVYSLFARVDLIDSLPATIVFLAATSLPIAIWLLKNSMDDVPVALEEAAWTDGASAMVSLRRVVVPLMAPGMLVAGIFTFIGAWGNFFVPFILLVDEQKLPAAVTIYTFFGQYGTAAYGQLAAFSLLYTAPVVALYVVASRFLGGSFTLGGAVKG